MPIKQCNRCGISYMKKQHHICSDSKYELVSPIENTEEIKLLKEESDKLASYARHTAKLSARALEKNMRYEKAIYKAIDQVQSGAYVEDVVWTLTSALDEYKNEEE